MSKMSKCIAILYLLLHIQITIGTDVLQLDPLNWSTMKEANAKSDADAIIRESSLSNIVYDRLAYMTDTFGPRLSGSSALERALDWVKEEAKKDGIKVQEEHVMVPCWVRGHEYATLISPRVTNIRMAGLGGSVSTPNGKPLIAKVLVVSSFRELEARKDEAKGRIVLYNEEFTVYGQTIKYRTLGAKRAEEYGAVASLVRSVANFGLKTVHTGSSEPSNIPAAAITFEDAEMFARMQARGQDVVLKLYMEAKTIPDQPSRNLILEIEGSEKHEELVVFGGHMDSWDIAYGAMDDGGGALVSWEVIRLIHNLGLKPKRTLRAVLFVNEENGARGGYQYSEDHENELNMTSIAIETDEGTFTPYGISFSGSRTAREILKDMGKELLAGIGAGNVSGTGYGTDIMFLCEQGVPCGNLLVLDPRVGDSINNPCLGYSHPPYPEPNGGNSAYFWYHHTEADTIDKLSPEQLQTCAAALAVWTYTIANLDELLPR